MPTAIQKITHRIHGQRRLLVPSIMMRRGYLKTAHLGQIESELQAIISRHSQITPRREAVVRQLKALPNYGMMLIEELHRRASEITNEYDELSDHMDLRMAHLKAMKKNITQFKLN